MLYTLSVLPGLTSLTLGPSTTFAEDLTLGQFATPLQQQLTSLRELCLTPSKLYDHNIIGKLEGRRPITSPADARADACYRVRAPVMSAIAALPQLQRLQLCEGVF